MSKRPYFVITHIVDYDGYNTYVDYIGTNLQAALKRFHFLCDDIKQKYFNYCFKLCSKNIQNICNGIEIKEFDKIRQNIK